MKKHSIYILSVVLLLFGSCSKWLDVKPEDKFIEEEVFSTPQGFYDALNGLYLNLGANSMYGKNLSMFYPEILAHMYALSPSHDGFYRALQAYNYEEEAVTNNIARIWENYYLAIARANKVLSNLTEHGQVLDDRTRDMFYGEAYAVRGFVYLELLRFFAPSFGVNATAELIPYYDEVTYEFSDFKTSEFIMEKIQEDFLKAEQLLKATDPAMDEEVVSAAPSNDVDMGIHTYMYNRSYRLNYYAVKGLQARAYLWAGDKAKALQAAKVIIENESKFPWSKGTEINDGDRPDRIFSKEILFAVENSRLYEVYDDIFNPALEDKNLFTAGTSNDFLNNVYEGVENDYRYNALWKITGGKIYPTFQKYRDNASSTGSFRHTIPMLKKAEIYLIAAESETDSDRALAYLNEVRSHRNVHDITQANTLQEDILKETRREFYGEGQLWFFYKRNNNSAFDSANGGQVGVATEDYTFPIPLSETEPR